MDSVTAGTVPRLVLVSHDFRQTICNLLLTSSARWLTEPLSARVSPFFSAYGKLLWLELTHCS